MGSNYIAEDATITPSIQCIHDSIIGYSADFTKNGNVDGWEYFDGIHTYGCWDGFLFGTLYQESSTIGRFNVFRAVNATTHYFIRLVMKYNPWPRDERGIHPLPTQGKLRWRTLQSTNWDSDKETYFDIEADNRWHTYLINVGIEQWWQGDINDLRIWPAVDDADDGDEFFIRAIDIFSTESHECRNTSCEKFSEYVFPCPWIGLRAIQESTKHDANERFNIDDLSEFIININGYGNERVKIKEVLNGSGREVSNALAKAISRTNIGGYAEVQVEYTDDNIFKVYSGTIHEDSSVDIVDNELSRYLKFFDSAGNDISTKTDGETPVDGYSPLSSFKIKTHQALGLLDNDERTALTFNPFQYSLEGGRRDWLSSGTGLMSASVGEESGDFSMQTHRTYYAIPNNGRTIVDFNHPFNASGRIKKIWVQCTLDDPDYRISKQEEAGGSSARKEIELSGAKIMIMRPKRRGNMEVIYEWDLNDRDPDRGYYDALYSITQEGLDIDVDVFVNKGDMIAIWNANMYAGKSVSGFEYDCQFHQIDFKPEIGEEFDPGRLYGDGSSGLLVYAHGDEAQKRLYLDIDLGHRYNIEKLEVKGEALNTLLEYNIASCLDINWQCDLFGEYHWTHYKRGDTSPVGPYDIQRFNVYYGLDNLNDGVYNVPDGLACDSYSLTSDIVPLGQFITYNGGPGLAPTNPHYFWVNGDEEWLGVWLHAAGIIHTEQSVYDFDNDPVALYLHFPHEKQKQIYKVKMFFKEKANFRSFGLSTYGGFYYTLGDADDVHYDLIPEYTKITLDNVESYEGSPNYNAIEPYLFQNPCTGHKIYHTTAPALYEWDPIYSDVIRDYSPETGYGAESGYFVTQTFQVDNADAWSTARRVDWQVIEHEWDPIVCKGFRIYCDYHKSTKITELELYGVAEDIGSNMAGGIVVTFSDYGEVWWPTESVQNTEDSVEVFIGDSPRYFSFEIVPVTETRYDDIVIQVKTEDLYAGRKGCEYIYYSGESKINTINKGQVVEVKNNYGAPYDLSIDIAPGKLIEEGLLFYSDLKNAASIFNPAIGPDARYYKLDEYSLMNQDYNCAINCHTFGLHNLIDGVTAHYTYNDMLSWEEYGQLNHGSSIDFYNLPTTSKTIIYIPQIKRNRYWKFGPTDPYNSMNIREMRIYDAAGNYLDPEFYHDLNKDWFDAPVSERAPHLENDSVVGSYYTLEGDQYITMDLGDLISIGRIEMWHDGISDYVNFERTTIPYSGIDKYTKMCLRAWKDNTGSYLQDVSYYEHDVTMHGSAHIDVGLDASNVSVNVDLGCTTSLVDWSEKTDTYYPKDLTPEGTWFTPVSASGTVSSGTCEHPGYVDFNIRCHDVGTDRYYYDMREDSAEAYKLFQQMPFEITFTIELNDYYPGGRDGHGGTYTDYQPAVCVGAISTRRRLNSNFLGGAQMWFAPPSAVGSNGTFPGRFGLAIRTNPPFTIGYYVATSPNDYTNTYVSGLDLNTKYYCKLTCYGGDNDHRDNDSILYRAEVWTDAIDGTNRIVNLTRTTDIYWEANDFAIAGAALQPTTGGVGDTTTYGCGSVKGTVYDMKLNVNHDVKRYPWRDEETSIYEECSIRIPSGTNNYVQIKNSLDIDLGDRYHTHDFWIKFRDLPAEGERYTIMEQYDYDAASITTTRGWRLALYNGGSYYRWEWWLNRGEDYGYQWSLEEYNGQTGSNRYVNHFNIVKDKWYFMVFSSGTQYGSGGFFRRSFFDISGRATFDSSYPGNAAVMYDIPAGSDIIIGKDFDGWVCEPRISRADYEGGTDHGGHRYSSSSIGYATMWEAPIRPYARMYAFSLYVSSDNQHYGHHSNVDTMFQVDNSTYLPYLYYFDGNEFAANYNTYFAIDLGHRYDIDIVRRYGATDDHLITETSNVIYSKIDTDDPYEAFMTEPGYDTNDDFYGYGGVFIDKDRWRISTSVVGNEYEYLSSHNGRLEHKVDSGIDDVRFYSNFGFRDDFDIQIKCGKVSAPNTFNWWAEFRVDMSDEVMANYQSTSVDQTLVSARMEYRSDTASPYYRAKAIFTDGGSTISSHIALDSSDTGLRIIRFGFHFYVMYYQNGSWHALYDAQIYDAEGKDVNQVHIGLACDSGYPTTMVYWKDFKINSADKIVERSTINDARWMAIEMLNGDNTSRYIKKLGLYPELTKVRCPDNYNYNTKGWTDLGPSVTGYSTGTNVALDTTVSGSSYIGSNTPGNVTDGVIDNTRNNAWMSDNSSEQWLLIDLGEEKQIYRVKIYHGWSTADSDFMVEDYRIESSLDNQVFTTQWSITNNSSFNRTHDKADPFTARYIRMYITDYKADNLLYIKEEDGINFYEWRGACLREIEVYEYYGYDHVSSEEWPIVAINLRDQFYIQGYSLVGLFTEYDFWDWSNDSSNFAWSDSIRQDPQKVSFSSWGSEFDYEQWLVIKRDTATYHNIDPSEIAAVNQSYGIDYLKHVLIESTTKENPINYPTWWSSIISTISRDFSHAVELCISSLKIAYPASTALDTVQFIEGSNWGVDSDMEFRDGLGFRWYIEDVDKLDTTEGYVFFGGLDGTDNPQQVEYRWFLSTLSGTTALQTGWNRPYFRFKDADEVIYNEDVPINSFITPTMTEYTQLQTFGFKFKGKGEAFNMNIDGAVIQRNHFQDSSKFDFGLYLAGSDYLETPLGELDLKAGTIEFWIRPDYTFGGLDIHRRFKNRSLFHFGNVANDVFGFMINSSGFNIYYGNATDDLSALVVTGIIAGAIDGLFHIAVVFSANGANLAGDNSSIKLYINNGLVATNYDPWTYTDEKLFKFTLGGKGSLALIQGSGSLETTSINSVVSNLRIYNYCKSDFTDSMNNTFSSYGNDLLLPAKMIEISQDNVTYYKVGDAELPFYYEKVPNGDTVQIYVRSTIPGGLTGQEDRTAGILTQWDIGI